jgi:serine protease Do
VTPSGGAAKAGIEPQDVLVSIDGRHIKDGDDLVADISARPVGSSVKIGYLRDGKERSTVVTIGDRAKTYADVAGADANPDQPTESDAGQTKLGITVTALPPAAAQKAGVKGGVTVTSVTPGSFADEVGLGKGALITEINKHAVTDESSYKAAVSGLKTGDDVVFVIHGSGKASGNNYIGGTLR